MQPGSCILSETPEALGEWLSQQGEPSYRLGQLLRWLYESRVESFDAMTNLSTALRERLCESYHFPVLKVLERLTSSDGQTEKSLFELSDGEQIEAVAMAEEGRHTFCISSQVGCALGCSFCATGQQGFVRDLTVGEMLGQVMALARSAGGAGNVVFMGMGEPLLNCDAVLPALEALADERRLGLGARRITVSTAGITPGIRRLGGFPVKPNLALSLNSPFDAQRSELMPIGRRYPLAGILSACRDYAAASKRRILLEYVLLSKVNTSPAAAVALARIARHLRALINLISFNPVPGSEFGPPEREEVERFKSALERSGVKATVRFRRGRDILAGCGQLRSRRSKLSGQ